MKFTIEITAFMHGVTGRCMGKSMTATLLGLEQTEKGPHHNGVAPFQFVFFS